MGRALRQVQSAVALPRVRLADGLAADAFFLGAAAFFGADAFFGAADFAAVPRRAPLPGLPPPFASRSAMSVTACWSVTSPGSVPFGTVAFDVPCFT